MKYLSLAFALFFCLSTSALQAQKKNTGFVVTVTGDTLRGYFDFTQLGAAMSMNVRVTFVDAKTNSSIKYAPFQIKGWQLDKDPVFNESKVLKRKGEDEGYAVFMKRLTAKGDVICYRYTENTTQMPITEYYLERNQQFTYIPFTKKFYEVVADYIKDNKELSDAVQNKVYKGNKEKALLQIVAAYNEWFDANW